MGCDFENIVVRGGMLADAGADSLGVGSGWMLWDGTRIKRMTRMGTDFRDSLDVGIGRIL